MKKLMAYCTIMALVAAPSVLAAYTLVDDFESYSVATFSGGSTASLSQGGPWRVSGLQNTGAVAIQNDGDNYLAFGYSSASARNPHRAVTPIADGSSGWYYYQFQSANASADFAFGLSDVVADGSTAFDNYATFEVQIGYNNGNLVTKNGATTATIETGLSAGTWYDVWLYVDNAADTFDVYFGQTGSANILGTQIATNFSFRNAGAGNVGDLVTFMGRENDGGTFHARLDNIYYSDPAEGEDDLLFGTTTPANGAVNVDELPLIEAVIIDSADTINTGSVVLSLDGEVKAHTLFQSGATSTVSYAVTTALAEWSVHTAQVVAASSLGNYYTNEWSFTVTGPNIVAETGPTHFATLATDGAWTWYNDPRAIFHNGQLYFGYVRAGDGKSALDVFDLSTGEATKLWNSGFTQLDDHNNPGLCSKSDGMLLAIYSRHISDQYFAYRTSSTTDPDTPADWNAEQIIPNSGAGMTYANPFQLSGEGGKIYNFCRNLNFNPTIYTSADGGSTWSAPQHFISTGGGGTRPYVKYSSDGTSRVDFLYTDGHPRDVNNSLYHMYYENGSFYKTDGVLVNTYASLPLDHDSGERGSVIYQYNTSAQADPNEWIPSGRAWCWETATDTNGNPVSVFTVRVQPQPAYSDQRIYYYYARWTGAEWQKRFVAHAGRPLYNGENDYAGGICVDPQNPNVIYISSNMDDPFNLSLANTALNANDRYELWRGETSDGGLTFDWEPVTTHSTVDNLRPYVPRRNGGEECVIWFRGTYTTYTSYACSVVGLFTTDVPVPPPPAPITYVDASSGASGNTTEWNGSSWVTFNPPLNIVSAADNQWEEEAGAGLGNGPSENWFESNREGTENCPQLRTTVTGLPDNQYDLYAYFWVANGQGFKFGASLANNPVGSLPLYTVGSAGVAAADVEAFESTVSVKSGDRTLHQVSLGTVTGTTVAVYIDDEANGGYGSSCWYDGIGYRLHLATTPADLTVGITNALVTVSWPQSHKGWVLQSKTNLTNDWADVNESTTNTTWGIPGSSIEDSEFFRIRYPLE